LTFFENNLLDNDVDQMQGAEIVEPSNSPYCSQCFYVWKKDPQVINNNISEIISPEKLLEMKINGRRLVTNYKPINLKTIKDSFPPPVIKDIYNHLKDSVYYVCLDMTKGYWQIKLHEDSKHKTAFRTRKGLFHYLRLPFGLVNASAMYTRIMYKVFEGLPFVESYIDDCVVHAPTIDLLFEHLEVVMERIQSYNLRINWKKCQWFKTKVKLLGQIISHNLIEMDKDKVSILLNWPIPVNTQSLMDFLGLANYNRNKIIMFAKIAAPLYELLKKDYAWELSPERLEAFNSIKTEFGKYPCLRLADLNRPFIVKPDGCGVAIGYILAQIDDNKVEYMVEADSRVLTPAERTYSIYEIEMLAYIFAIVKCRQYLDGVHFTCYTDHEALIWFDSIRHILSKHRLRWYLTAQGFNCTFKHRPGILHSDADAVSRVLTHDLDRNTANLPISETAFSFKSNCAPRDNSLAILDAGDKEVSSNSLVSMKLRICSSPCEIEFKEMVARQLSLLDRSAKSIDPWEDNNLLKFIQTGRHSNGIGKKQVGRIEILARRYVFSDNILLYKYQQIPGEDTEFRIVPPIIKREDIVRQAHYLGHFAAEKTMSEVRTRFYWPHMYKDVDFVLRNCINCLKYKKYRAKDHPALSLPILGINDRVSIDQVHGLPLTIRGFSGVNFLTEHVTGYATGHPLKGKTAEESGEHLWEHITRFGPMKKLLSDNGGEYANAIVNSLTKLVGADHLVTSAYRPSTNGLQERGNSTLCEALRVFCSIDGNKEDWDLKLPFIIMSYNLMINSSRKFSPHELLFARKMNHFEDYKVNSSNEEVPMLLKRAAEIRLFHEETLPKAVDNLLHAQQQHRKSQDRQHNIQIEPLEVGSKVMLWDPKIKGKLDVRKSGPYIISKRSARNNYFITNCRTQVALKNAIPLRRLELVPNSVTEIDETAITNYDISRIISV
jgi:hypothetical protein